MKVFIDSREQLKWDFSFWGFEQEIICLQTGDYFFEDYPDLVIERKRNTGEISINFGSKWKQFEAEFVRMSKYKHSYLICEFPIDYLDIFPDKSGIPKNKINKIRMPGWLIKKKLFENCEKYNIKPLFFNNSEEAQLGVIEILKNYDRI